ncbi:MAG: hypothetical protein ACRDHF_17810 [Tepidiformaceae bacterium]
MSTFPVELSRTELWSVLEALYREEDRLARLVATLELLPHHDDGALADAVNDLAVVRLLLQRLDGLAVEHFGPDAKAHFRSRVAEG